MFRRGWVTQFDEHHTSPHISVLFKIKTPEGAEVNKIYTCKQNHNILVTKSDLRYVWHFPGVMHFLICIYANHTR